MIAATIRNVDTFSAFVQACGALRDGSTQKQDTANHVTDPEKSGISLVDVDYPIQPAEYQDGPFYAAVTPIRIVKITSTRPAEDPFAI